MHVYQKFDVFFLPGSWKKEHLVPVERETDNVHQQTSSHIFSLLELTCVKLNENPMTRVPLPELSSAEIHWIYCNFFVIFQPTSIDHICVSNDKTWPWNYSTSEIQKYVEMLLSATKKKIILYVKFFHNRVPQRNYVGVATNAWVILRFTQVTCHGWNVTCDSGYSS